MTSDILIQKLRSIIGQNDKDAFIEKAIKLEQVEYSEKHFDWSLTYPLGIYADLYEFPAGYVQVTLITLLYYALFLPIRRS